MRIAVYPGTFDPITNGHVDIIQRTLQLFDRVIVAIASNPKKGPLFPPEERLSMAREALSDLQKVSVEMFEGLLVDYARRKEASVVIRGLRAVSDFEYELQMALMNRKLDRSVETVFLMPSEEFSYLTSTIVKEVASYGGDVSQLVPKGVADRLVKRFSKGSRP
jgi:pantetheine-phosphate adenylyltransferase